MAADELIELTATEAVRAMRQGDLKAEDYASALLARCGAGKSLNAFITLEPPRVLEAARAADRLRASGAPLPPLHGLPIPVKDSVNTKDLPTTGGTPALRNFHPKQDAPLVQRLLDAGGIVLGKTNLHELSWGWSSNNLAFGAVRNPYDPTRIPGGSSGGTAAAVAARMAPLGVAEDTEGSIRVPAALCGIYGFRPTTGRYPTSGVVPISPLFDQIGPHARAVSDLVLFDQVASGDQVPLAPLSLQGVRIGIGRQYYFDKLDPEVARVAEAALRKLEDAGAVLVEAEVRGLARFDEKITDVVQNHDVVPMLTKYLEEFGAGLSIDQLLGMASSDVRRDFELDCLPGAKRGVSEDAYRAARDTELPALRMELQPIFPRERSDGDRLSRDPGSGVADRPGHRRRHRRRKSELCDRDVAEHRAGKHCGDSGVGAASGAHTEWTSRRHRARFSRGQRSNPFGTRPRAREGPRAPSCTTALTRAPAGRGRAGPGCASVATASL